MDAPASLSFTFFWACSLHGSLAGSAATAFSPVCFFRYHSPTTALYSDAPARAALSAGKPCGRAAKYDRTDLDGESAWLAPDSPRDRLCGFAPPAASLRA